MKPQLLITLVSYKDLSLLRQILVPVRELMALVPTRMLVLDNAHDDALEAFLKQEYPLVEYVREAAGNLGYGPGHNALLRQVDVLPPFHLVLTSDVFIDPLRVKQAVDLMEEDKELMQVGAKLYFWDLKQQLFTQKIDSLGVVAQKQHHFYDRGQGEMDRGQYDAVLQKVFGISGAVFLIRTSVFPALHGKARQLFDERMWMYKEDIDLAYRLRWLGFKIRVLPEVWAWHARTLANHEGKGLGALRKADVSKASYGRLHSYKNHILLLKNNLVCGLGFGVWLRVLFYEFLKGMYLLLRHPRVFFAGLGTLLFVKGQPSAKVLSSKAMLDHFE